MICCRGRTSCLTFAKRKFEVCWSRVWLQLYFCSMAVVERLLLFCVTLLNTLSEEKKESGEPYRFGKILRAHYIFSLFYPGVRVRPLAFIVAFAALLFPQQGQCNTTLCQLTVNVRIVRFNVQALLYLYGKSIRFESALVMSSSTGHCMACLSISAKTSRTVCREQ